MARGTHVERLSHRSTYHERGDDGHVDAYVLTGFGYGFCKGAFDVGEKGMLLIYPKL